MLRIYVYVEVTMIRRLALLALVVMTVLGGASVAVGQGTSQAQQGPVTQAVIKRGELICGANKAGLAGFATVNAAGDWQGFDIDICRAVAVAILGDAKKITFR